MAKRSEPALSKPEARTGLRGRATDEVKVRGFHQGHGRQLSPSNRPDICEQTRFSIIKKDDGLAPRLGPYMRALTWRFGAWRPRSAAVSMDSGEHGLPRLSFFRVWDSSDKIQGDSNPRSAFEQSGRKIQKRTGGSNPFRSSNESVRTIGPLSSLSAIAANRASRSSIVRKIYSNGSPLVR
jgi:hypothetical protein